ncbi:phosphotyrosine protein phosphatase [Rothia sp. HMSC069C03]|uniref:arsenate reductase/protein-tyrosine-phosphatase family protein n=1 Tax=Rothia sp. HMSC069C03 TaxID=1739283 RepID=UPI0008D3EE0F|nr:phosphotyrosine protein phosphatase [Rothia sp. HMSC069C03]OFL22550.1 phosphotyrosine protein phosphatase [Rothia sp. HMSC069C03]
MGIFNIKSLKDKYAWGSSEDKTNSTETAEEQQATPASSSANIADGVRSLIKSNPELAGKNRRGVASRTITPDGSLREAIEDYKVRSPAEVASQEVTPEEELSADGTATVSQPLTHTDIEATPGDILDVDGKTTGPSIIRVGHHNAPTVDAEELADPEEANSQSAGNVQSSPATDSRGERTPLFRLSPKTLNRTGSTSGDGPFEAVFVCTGNIARSASGEVISKHLAAEYGLEDKWIFASAGTGALVGHGVYEHVANELIERGYNPEGFASRQLNGQIVENATIILVAEKVHADWIVREWPQHHAKIKLLKQVARIREDARRAEPLSYLYSYGARPLDSDKLEDPYRRGPAAAKVAVDEVEQSLRVILPWLAQAHR